MIEGKRAEWREEDQIGEREEGMEGKCLKMSVRTGGRRDFGKRRQDRKRIRGERRERRKTSKSQQI
eukprot:747870-Hanusia_phi.AAC.7